MKMRVKTKRLILQSVSSDDDIQRLATLLTDPFLADQVGLLLPETKVERIAAIKMLVKGNHILLINHPANGDLLGMVELSVYHGEEGKILAHQYELGYLLVENARNNGYMTEAVRGMIDLLPGGTILHAIVREENTPSRRVLAKCGFTSEDNKHWILHKLAI
jgi:RimJ/RimL family protein N-acetyltransferase